MSIPVVLDSRNESGGKNQVRLRPFSLPVTILSIFSCPYSPEANSITVTRAQHKLMNGAPHTPLDAYVHRSSYYAFSSVRVVHCHSRNADLH